MGTVLPTAGSIRRLARDRLGFDQLRPGQLEAISAAAAGRSVVAVLPTGAGKSAIYELAGLLKTGPTVVVSSMIALEHDQLAHLHDAGLSATVVNSKLSSRARTEAPREPGLGRALPGRGARSYRAPGRGHATSSTTSPFRRVRWSNTVAFDAYETSRLMVNLVPAAANANP
jgi:hypothetical protein